MKIRHLNLNGTVYDISGNEYLSELSAENNPWFFTDAVNYYVDANGNDDNDGLSFSTPFKTIQKAINSVNNKYVRVRFEAIIHINGGVYNENVDVYNCSVINIELHGNVTINGSLKVIRSSVLVLCDNEQDYTLNIMESSLTNTQATLEMTYTDCVFRCNVGITGSQTYPCLFHQATINFSRIVNVYNSGTNASISCNTDSHVHFNDLRVNGNGNKQVIAYAGSMLSCAFNTDGELSGVDGGRAYSGNQSVIGSWSIDNTEVGIIHNFYAKTNNIVTVSLGIRPTRALNDEVVGHVPESCKPLIASWGMLPLTDGGYVSIDANGIIRVGCSYAETDFFTTITYVGVV